MSHFDKLVHLPDGFKTIATTKNSEFAGIAHDSQPVFGMCVLSKLSLSFTNKHDWQASNSTLRSLTQSGELT
jgi:hypothetical protein